MYIVYILTDPKHPAVYILTKKIKAGTIISIVAGLFILTFGISLLLTFLPMLLDVIS